MPWSNPGKGNIWQIPLCSLTTVRKKRLCGNTSSLHGREAQVVSVLVEAVVAAIKAMKRTGYRYFFILTCLFLLTFFSKNSRAEDYANADTYIHDFNNGIIVYSGVFALNKDITLDTSAYFKYTLDLINPSFFSEEGEGEDEGHVKGDKPVAAISGASAASGRGGDTRNELTAGITHNFADVIGIEMYYDYSKEGDYTSNTPTVTFKKDLFEKNTTLTLGYSKSMDQVYGKFMTGTKDRDTDNYFFGITQVISPVTVARAGYSRSKVTGFTSEGIRLVPIDGATQASCTDKSVTCVDEVFPDARSRNAYLFGINYYFKDGFIDLLKRSALRLTLRYYSDDWDIHSHTEEVEYYKYLSDQNIIRLNLRYYDQGKAFFVKDAYLNSDLFKSSSPQLTDFNSQLIGIKLTHALEDIEGGYIEGKYEYYTQSINVNANVFMLGVRFNF